MPENSLPADIRDIYQDMWANNGDAISRQYAGTAAMKVKFGYLITFHHLFFL
jgi:uncharacterized protein (DUF2267 family)